MVVAKLDLEIIWARTTPPFRAPFVGALAAFSRAVLDGRAALAR